MPISTEAVTILFRSFVLPMFYRWLRVLRSRKVSSLKLPLMSKGSLVQYSALPWTWQSRGKTRSRLSGSFTASKMPQCGTAVATPLLNTSRFLEGQLCVAASIVSSTTPGFLILRAMFLGRLKLRIENKNARCPTRVAQLSAWRRKLLRDLTSIPRRTLIREFPLCL